MNRSLRVSVIVLAIAVIVAASLFYLLLNSGNRLSPAYIGGTAEPSLLLSVEDAEDGFPAIMPDEQVISHTGFSLVYSEEFEQAAWVAYILRRDQVTGGGEERTDNFRADTAILTGSAAPADYLRSGYDRGHLAPAADMKWSPAAMSESFLMSNMSPQQPGFNRGVWNRLEARVRQWAVENDSILVITGPVLNGIDTFIGENRVGVPWYFYKIVADISPPDYKIIAFLLENRSSGADLMTFAVSVDSVESVTGLDFFHSHPNREIIEYFESRTDKTGW